MSKDKFLLKEILSHSTKSPPQILEDVIKFMDEHKLTWKEVGDFAMVYRNQLVRRFYKNYGKDSDAGKKLSRAVSLYHYKIEKNLESLDKRPENDFFRDYIFMIIETLQYLQISERVELEDRKAKSQMGLEVKAEDVKKPKKGKRKTYDGRDDEKDKKEQVGKKESKVLGQIESPAKSIKPILKPSATIRDIPYDIVISDIMSFLTLKENARLEEVSKSLKEQVEESKKGATVIKIPDFRDKEIVKKVILSYRASTNSMIIVDFLDTKCLVVDNNILQLITELFPNLQELSLNRVKKNLDLSYLQNLKRLKKFTCRNEINHSFLNPITPIKNLSQISSLSELEELNLSNILIGVEELGRITNSNSKLIKLGLFNCDITSVGVNYLRNLPQLQELNLNRNNINGLSFLLSLTELRVFKMQKCMITDGEIIHLENLTKLRELDLSYNELTHGALSHLENLSELRILRLDQNPIRRVASLNHLRNLEELSLNTELGTISDLETLDLPKLQKIYLNGFHLVNDKNISFVERMPKLVEVSLDNAGITNEGLEFLKKLTNLQKLSLQSNSFLTISDLCGFGGNLKYLNLCLVDHYNSYLDDRYKERVIGSLNDLDILNQLEHIVLFNRSIPYIDTLRKMSQLKMITIYDVNGGDSVSLLPSELIEYLEQKDREGKKVLSLAPELLKMCQEIENTELDYDNNKIDLILPLRLGLNNNVYVAKTVSTTYQIGVDQFIKDIREFVVSEKYSAVFPIYVYDVDPAKSGHFVGLFLEKPSESEDIKGIYFDPRGCEDQYFSDDQLREVEEILMMNLGKYYRSLELSKTKIQAYSEFEPNNNCGVFVIEVLSNMADNWTRCIDGNLQSSSGGKVTPLLDYPPEISNHLGKEFRKGHSELIKNNHKLIKINIPSQQKPLPFLRNILYPFSQVIAGIEYEKKSR